jgi:electron transport complex protein RnfG
MTEQGGGHVLKSAASLGLVAIIGTGLLAMVNHLTQDRIAAQERRVVLEQLGQIIPPGAYDNALQDDRFTFHDEAHFPNGQRVTAFRARLQGRPIAVILKFAAVDGYNGNIHLLAGISADGKVIGVRVTSHKETPGLGDAIETGRSDWVLDFDDKSLRNPAPEAWSVRRAGGEFDQFTGATITPAAVVRGVRMALEYFAVNKDLLFDSSTQPEQ